MEDARKTKTQLKDEVVALRVRIEELESSLAAVRESDAMSRLLADSIDDRVRAKDGEGHYLYVNPAFAKASRLTVAEIIGKTGGDLYDDETASKIARADANALLGETVRILQEKRTPSGERFFDTVINPIRDSSSRIVGTVSVSRDITEIHRADSAYRESEERFRQIAENMETGLWLRDPGKEEVLYANQAFRNIWEMRDSGGRIDLIHPDDRGQIVSRTREQIEGHEVEPETAFRIVREDGEIRWIECRTFPIRNEQGNVYRYAGTVNDVTDRRQMERAAARLARENDILAEIGQTITSSLNIDEVYERFAERVQDLIPSDRTDIVTINLNRGEMRYEYIHGIDVDGHHRAARIHSTAGRVCGRGGRPNTIGHSKRAPRQGRARAGASSWRSHLRPGIPLAHPGPAPFKGRRHRHACSVEQDRSRQLRARPGVGRARRLPDIGCHRQRPSQR